MTRTATDSGKSYSQGRDMSQGIQIGGAASITNPEAFLTGNLKAGVVTFTFGAQCISPLETGAFPVNGKPVGIRYGSVFGAAFVFLAIVPVFVVTGAATCFGLAERTAKLLT